MFFLPILLTAFRRFLVGKEWKITSSPVTLLVGCLLGNYKVVVRYIPAACAFVSLQSVPE